MWDLIVSVPDHCLSFYFEILYHPLGNGTVERFNRTLLNMILILTSELTSDWKSHVSTSAMRIMQLYMSLRAMFHST